MPSMCKHSVKALIIADDTIVFLSNGPHLVRVSVAGRDGARRAGVDVDAGLALQVLPDSGTFRFAKVAEKCGRFH